MSTLRMRAASSRAARRVGGAVARRGRRALEASVALAAVVQGTRPLKILVLSLATLAAGGLGLMVAYAATPDDGLEQQILVTNGETYTIATVTGPSGTTTVAVTKTKDGKTKLIPVRVTRTVDGPGETDEVFVDVAGEAIVLTETDTALLTQIDTRVETQERVVTQFVPVTQTDVVTNVVTEVVTHPVTVTEVVNHTETVVQVHTVTETQTVTESVTVTETLPPP